MAEKVVVSRLWKSPEITVRMSSSEIGGDMDIDSYLESLVDQVTSLSITFTKSALLAKLKDAHANVVNEIKHSTRYVV